MVLATKVLVTKVLPDSVENWVGLPELVPGNNPLIDETVSEEIAAVLPITPVIVEKTIVLTPSDEIVAIVAFNEEVMVDDPTIVEL
jgi:hypothetical protein